MICAIGTPVPTNPFVDSALPGVPMLTAPPNHFLGTCRYLIRRQRRIFRAVPLSGQIRMSDRQPQVLIAVVILATGYALPFPQEILHACLPHKLPPPPPILFLRAIKHLIRRQREIKFVVPFPGQFRILRKQGIICTDRSDVTIGTAF